MVNGRWVHSSMHAVLIEHSHGVVCWDTGAPRDWRRRWADTGLEIENPYEFVSEGEYFEDRLEQLGYGPGDVTHALLSHLHCDHAGNVSAYEGTQARIIVHERELKAALAVEGKSQGPYVRSSYESTEFETVAGDTEILPGIKMIETPGHTPGSMSLLVTTKRAGVLLFAADAVYLRDSYRPRLKMPGIVWSEDDWRASADRIRTIEDEQDALVVCGHDARQLERLRLAPNSYYE
jgi:glyoxylase-like metal-dependent hydrolase (beta-lactamase superfamily II)